ncbi:MAG: hypothetical protein JW791_01660 [Nanoarchaeota archaeon]|nr:hypothetical protein [Nanoarchaeota archaeon]
MFFRKKKKNKDLFMLLLVVILSVLLVIIGFSILKSVFFPLLISAVWAILLKLVKKTVRNFFFSSEN